MPSVQDPECKTRSLRSIPSSRELTSEEQLLLREILERVDPGRLGEITSLQIIGRCGCGTCPTIIFGVARDQPISTTQESEIAQYTGVNAQGQAVGLALIVRDGALSELETWGSGWRRHKFAKSAQSGFQGRSIVSAYSILSDTSCRDP